MNQISRFSFSWMLSLIVLLAIPLVVLADTIAADADLITTGNQSSLNLGNVTPGQILTPPVSFVLVCAGKNHVDIDQSVAITFNLAGSTVPAGGALNATNASIGPIPASWPDDTTGGGSTNCPAPAPTLEDNGNSTVTITAPTTPGTYSYVVKYSLAFSPSGGDDSSDITGPAPVSTFTLTVDPPADSTPPVITPNVSGTLGNNGWYISDVNVSWTVTDPESAISSSSGCDPTTINADTGGTTLTCSATSAGGANSQSVTIMRDATAPTISGSASPAPNGAGWNNTDVSVSFSCADNLSGIASCGPNQALSSEGMNQSAMGTAMDNAGNSASTTVSSINIDKTGPIVSVTGVTHGATYILGSVPAAGCDTQDGLSGVAVNASLSVSGGNNGVGSFTATCNGASDNAGNAGNTANATYNVIYNWNGFFQPVDNSPEWNKAKAGSAIPVKFSLDDNQSLSIFMSGYPKSEKIGCTNNSGSTDDMETVNAGGSSLSYDASTDQYNYVWKTEKSWAGTCRKLTVKLIDGTDHMAYFNFAK